MESPQVTRPPGEQDSFQATGILRSLQQHLDRVASEIRELSQKTEKLVALLPAPDSKPLHICAALEDRDGAFLPHVPSGDAGAGHVARSLSAANFGTSSTTSLCLPASHGQRTAIESVCLKTTATLPEFSNKLSSYSLDTCLGRRSESLPAKLFAIPSGRQQWMRPKIGGHHSVAVPDRTPNGRVFADAATHISTMQAALMTGGMDDACKYYHEAGHFFADLVRSHAFQYASFSMVAFSSIWMAIEIDAGEGTTLHVVMANVLCSYFSLELLALFLAFRDKRDVVKDMVFIFDALLVFLVVAETWMIPLLRAASGSRSGEGSNMRIALVFRLLRFLKVMRLGKVLRQLPELLIIVRGVLMAYKAISFTILLLAMIVYAGGLVFRVLLDGTALGADSFGTVPMAMGTLLIEATLSGSRGGRLLREAYSAHPACAACMLLYVVLANITMMGILGGLLVQAVKTVTEFEKAHIDFVELLKDLNEIWTLALKHDDDRDNCICLQEFEKIMVDPDSVQKLKSADVDMESLAMCSGFIFQQHGRNGKLTREQFMQCVLDHQGKQAAKVKDHVQTRRYLHSQLQAFVQAPPLPAPKLGSQNRTASLLR